MEWTRVAEDWGEIQDQFKTRWSRLADTDLKAIAGARKELIYRLELRYELENDAAQKEVDDFVRELHVPRQSSR